MTSTYDSPSSGLNQTAAGVDTGGVETTTGPISGAGLSSNGRLTLLDIERPGDPGVFAERVRSDAFEIMARYPLGQTRSALLPMLHLVQSEQGYVTADGIAFCADVLEITKAQVAAVATFYTMYKRRPTGEYLVSVCTNTLCGMLGGDDIYAALSDSLGVGMNQTAGIPGEPGSITLEHAECLAACDYAPVVTVNYEFFDNQTVESTSELVSQLQAGNRPLPTRGAPLCSFKEISRQIAGFVDTRAEASAATASGAPTEAGVRLAIERGETAPAYPHDDAGTTAGTPGTTTGPATGAVTPDSAQPTSAHDAPLNTAESDPAAPATGASHTQGELFGKES